VIGKSTLFNALSGAHVSEMGVERPKTFGPIVYAHRDCPIEKGFPFPAIQIERRPSEDPIAGPANGIPGHLLILEHRREDLSHLLVVDTPDLDSVKAENRQIAEDLYLLSDEDLTLLFSWTLNHIYRGLTESKRQPRDGLPIRNGVQNQMIENKQPAPLGSVVYFFTGVRFSLSNPY